MSRAPARANLLLGLALILHGLTGGSGCSGNDAPEPARETWRLRWQDEFDGPGGQLPDSTRWRFDIGTDWGNAQLEYDTDRPRERLPR